MAELHGMLRLLKRPLESAVHFLSLQNIYLVFEMLKPEGSGLGLFKISFFLSLYMHSVSKQPQVSCAFQGREGQRSANEVKGNLVSLE